MAQKLQMVVRGVAFIPSYNTTSDASYGGACGSTICCTHYPLATALALALEVALVTEQITKLASAFAGAPTSSPT